MYLSDANLELIRKRPQSAELFLSVFQPRKVLQCRVNDASIASGERTIAFDTTTFGSWAAVEAGMVLWVGSSAGAKDLGTTRIRSITSSQMVVAENSDVAWTNNAHLTVYRFFPILPVYPRIIQDPSNPEQVIFYKDYDIAYTNQNDTLGAFVNAGSHRAKMLETGSASLWYTSSGTSALISGTSLSYEWAFEGGTPTGSTAAHPGWVSYDTPGHYVTRLIVSGDNGSEETSYRYVSIYNPIASGTSLPFQKWSLDSLGGSRDEGGYTASVTLYETASVIEEGSVVVIFSKDVYGSTATSLGGNQENNSDVFFVGYVLDGSVQYDYEKSTVKFDIGSITRYIQQMLGFAVSVETKANPTKWFELVDMDIKRAIYHYLRWHTTVLSTTDVVYSGDNPQIQYFDSDRTSIYDAIDNLMRSAIVGKAVADRQGRVWIEPDITTSTTGSVASVMQITSRDWRNAPTVDELIVPGLSYLEMGGIQYHGNATGTFSALMACAPGDAPAYRGQLRQEQGLALNSQTHLNRIVKNLYAFENYPYKSIEMELAGAYRNLDIAPQEPVNVVIQPQDTVRGVSIAGDFNPNAMSFEHNPQDKMLLARTTLLPIVNGDSVQTMPVPPVPVDPGTPSPNAPNLPPFPPWPGGGGAGPGTFVIADIEEQTITDAQYSLVFNTTLRGNGTFAEVIEEWPNYEYTAILVEGGWYRIDFFVEVIGAVDGNYSVHIGHEIPGTFSGNLVMTASGRAQMRATSLIQYPANLGYWSYLVDSLCTFPAGAVGASVVGQVMIQKLT